jgi:hypothetical protein
MDRPEIHAPAAQEEGVQVVVIPFFVEFKNEGGAVGVDFGRDLGREGGREGGRDENMCEASNF